MNKFWAICKTTFVQTIRQPIYGIMILVTFGVLVVTLPTASWTGGGDYHATDQKLLENLGLSTLLVSGLLIAAFSASSVLTREIENKTALTVISKPVSRSMFVAGKFVGVWVAVAIGFYLCAMVFLLTIRHGVMPARIDPFDWPVIILGVTALAAALLVALAGNYFFGWSFISASVLASLILLTAAMAILSFIGKEWQIVPLGYETPEEMAIHGPLLIGITMIFMAVTVFVAIAIASSTRFGQIVTLLICFGVFFIGAMHPYLFGYLAKDYVAARVAGWLFPKLTYFFPLDALMDEEPNIPASYLFGVLAYCVLYVLAVLAIGMAMFERRQLEAQTSSASMPGAVALLAWTGRVSALAGGVAALFIATLPNFHNLSGVGLIAALLVAAAIGWALWSRFGAGDRWAYWLVLLGVVIALGAHIVMVVAPNALAMEATAATRVQAIAGSLIGGLCGLILILPKTRRHFRKPVA